MPFDTATSYRPGARFGPAAIRTGSRRQNTEWGHDLSWGVNPYLSLKVQDCGDIPLSPYDNALAVDQIETAYTTLISRPVNSSVSRTAHLARDAVEHPRIIALGGDHTIVWPILRSLHKVYGPISVIHFDAHIDTWPNLDGGFSEQSRVTHGTFFTLAYEEGLMSNTSIHAGIRTKVQGPQIIDHDEQVGFELLHANDLDDFGTDYIVEQIRERVGNSPVYLSFDIDTIDPGQAPGTGTPEPAGWTSRETKRILRGLTGLNLVGADIVEVAPAYDNADTTSIIAAGLVDDFLALLVLEEPPQARASKHRRGKHTVL
ncbi:arginase deacetylase [Coniophora puteana RWD-64-598 SS2]|uniref:Arginase deacetylase n=1 Tax=Coniophora puteana (strain RWD-64-598) TaxID=741705 RepID=A0A5M3N6I7_CONPW|nr:arginase deacetylase [Coniophora puteana RWD-64-598 SS2]EIW86926.1 arginase deacetylase [Coniophora puteana RWD-64-598 SS2]